jgi:vacuolar iron transporter family protein
LTSRPGDARVPDAQRAYHARIDPHPRTSLLSEIILGGQDGVVAVLGALLGVAAASADTHVVLAAGLATALADAISMAAVAYTSQLAQAEIYLSERAREYRHIRLAPTLERAEVRDIYARKGFAGDLLDRIVDTIVADPDVWVAVMMAEEHHLLPVDRPRALRSASVVGLATAIGASLPVAPFVLLPGRFASWASVAVAAGALFAVGAYKARLTSGSPMKGGAELALIGIASAMVGWGVGALLGVHA